MMELGATVCVPRGPRCLSCPVRAHCEALAGGVQDRVPRAKLRKVSPVEHRRIICIGRRGKWLIERRPSSGRWAGMWQFVTVNGSGAVPVGAGTLQRIGQIKHALTHRRYEFEIFTFDVLRDGHDPSPRRWATLDELDALPLPRPHLKVVEMLRAAHLSL